MDFALLEREYYSRRPDLAEQVEVAVRRYGSSVLSIIDVHSARKGEVSYDETSAKPD